MIDLDEIEAKAQAATPGKWFIEKADARDTPGYDRVFTTDPTGDEQICEGAYRCDATHIATVHPDVVLEWVAETRRLKAILEITYNALRETYWHTSGYDVAEHLKDFKGETELMKKIRQALKGDG